MSKKLNLDTKACTFFHKPTHVFISILIERKLEGAWQMNSSQEVSYDSLESLASIHIVVNQEKKWTNHTVLQ